MEKRILGIDFGLRHLGLAISDGLLAQPVTQKKYASLPEAINFLKHLCQEQQIQALVLGLSEGQLAVTVKAFGQKLHQALSLPVFYQDETLSTKEAKAKLLQAHAPLKKRRDDHAAAATLILQDYLDTIEINKGGK